MNVESNLVFKDMDGKPLMTEKGEFTLREAIIQSLVGNHKGDEDLPGDEKFKRWEMALRFRKAENEVEITVEEAAKIKALIAKSYGVLVVGQVWEWIK